MQVCGNVHCALCKYVWHVFRPMCSVLVCICMRIVGLMHLLFISNIICRKM